MSHTLRYALGYKSKDAAIPDHLQNYPLLFASILLSKN